MIDNDLEQLIYIYRRLYFQRGTITNHYRDDSSDVEFWYGKISTAVGDLFNSPFKDSYVLCVDESNSEQAWKTDFKFFKKRIIDYFYTGNFKIGNVNLKKIKAHSGYVKGLSKVWSKFEEQLLNDKLSKIYLVGNSMGGAVAQLIALLISFILPSCECEIVSFNCPRVFNFYGSKIFNAYIPNAYKFRLGNDIVSIIPPGLFLYGKSGKRFNVNTHFTLNLLSYFIDHGLLFEDERLTKYCKKIKELK